MTRAFSQHKASGRFARESRPVPSHLIANKTRLADRDARCVLSSRTAPSCSVVCFFRDERRRAHAFHERRQRRRCRAKPSRAVRDICDREHARARARGFEESHAELRACMHAYINASVPVAFLMLQRDADGSVAWSNVDTTRSPAKDAGLSLRSRDVRTILR